MFATGPTSNTPPANTGTNPSVYKPTWLSKPKELSQFKYQRLRSVRDLSYNPEKSHNVWSDEEYEEESHRYDDEDRYFSSSFFFEPSSGEVFLPQILFPLAGVVDLGKFFKVTMTN